MSKVDEKNIYTNKNLEEMVNFFQQLLNTGELTGSCICGLVNEEISLYEPASLHYVELLNMFSEFNEDSLGIVIHYTLTNSKYFLEIGSLKNGKPDYIYLTKFSPSFDIRSVTVARSSLCYSPRFELTDELKSNTAVHMIPTRDYEEKLGKILIQGERDELINLIIEYFPGVNRLELCREYGRKGYRKNGKRHQWRHVIEVKKIAMIISHEFPEVDLELLELAVIFHDIRYQNYETHVEDSVACARKVLKNLRYLPNQINLVTEAIYSHSGPHRREQGDTDLLEGKILYDADKFTLLKFPGAKEKYYPLFYLEVTRDLADELYP